MGAHTSTLWRENLKGTVMKEVSYPQSTMTLLSSLLTSISLSTFPFSQTTHASTQGRNMPRAGYVIDSWCLVLLNEFLFPTLYPQLLCPQTANLSRVDSLFFLLSIPLQMVIPSLTGATFITELPLNCLVRGRTELRQKPSHPTIYAPAKILN